MHSREQTEQIIDAAYEIATQATDDNAEWPHIFNQACALLSARVPVVEQAPSVPLGFDALPRLNGRG
jgi:hypothetical protein